MRFAIDRAGFVGADGPTHAGAFDTALPRLPAGLRGDGGGRRGRARPHGGDGGGHRRRPVARSAIRAATASASTCRSAACRWRSAAGACCAKAAKVALLSFGARLAECLKAAEELDAAYGLPTTVADARFAKPLDTDLIDRLAREHEVLVTVEEGAVGGFGCPCPGPSGHRRRAGCRGSRCVR